MEDRTGFRTHTIGGIRSRPDDSKYSLMCQTNETDHGHKCHLQITQMSLLCYNDTCVTPLKFISELSLLRCITVLICHSFQPLPLQVNICDLEVFTNTVQQKTVRKHKGNYAKGKKKKTTLCGCQSDGFSILTYRNHFFSLTYKNHIFFINVQKSHQRVVLHQSGESRSRHQCPNKLQCIDHLTLF